LPVFAEGFAYAWRSAPGAAIRLQSWVGSQLAEKARNPRLEALKGRGFKPRRTPFTKTCGTAGKPCPFKTPNAESFLATSLAAEVENSSSRALVTKWKISTRTKAIPPRAGKHFSRFRGTDAAALVEFAVALPLLIVLVVGIFDFGGAFNLKQELSNAAREGARFGASQPSNDFSASPAPSVDAVRYVVDAYLLRARINDCGLNTASQVLGASWTWLYTTTGTCAGGLVLTISRGIPVQMTVGGNTVTIPCTTVSISYPYQWHFNSVIQLLVPGASYAGVSQIPGDATAVNMD
jgi:Flp pilus assembly protein TadG